MKGMLQRRRIRGRTKKKDQTTGEEVVNSSREGKKENGDKSFRKIPPHSLRKRKSAARKGGDTF